jgi:transcriptional regulator with XRE-family HTH domain
LTREQFAERYGLQVRAIQEWEQGRRKPEPAVRAYMLVYQESACRGAQGAGGRVIRSGSGFDVLIEGLRIPMNCGNPVSRS